MNTNEEPKQETIEEAALKYFPKTNSHFDRLDEVDGNAYYRSIFKQGAKWQSERMYSLDQISKDFIGEDGSGGYFDDYLDFRIVTKEKLTFKEWFNQNKKII